MKDTTRYYTNCVILDPGVSVGVLQRMSVATNQMRAVVYPNHVHLRNFGNIPTNGEFTILYNDAGDDAAKVPTMQAKYSLEAMKWYAQEEPRFTFTKMEELVELVAWVEKHTGRQFSTTFCKLPGGKTRVYLSLSLYDELYFVGQEGMDLYVGDVVGIKDHHPYRVC